MNAVFNFGKLWENCFFPYYGFETLIEFSKDHRAIKYHLDNKEFVRVDEKGDEHTYIGIGNSDELFKQFQTTFYKDAIREISGCIEIVLNQLIVYLSTMIEIMNSEFFQCLFSTNPNLKEPNS